MDTKFLRWSAIALLSFCCILGITSKPGNVLGMLITLLVLVLPVLIYRFAIIKNPAKKVTGLAIAIVYSCIVLLVKLLLGTKDTYSFIEAALGGFINYTILMAANKAQKSSKSDPQVKREAQTGTEEDDLTTLMTGQLVAFYKITRDQKYASRYIKRLEKIGFSPKEADKLFQYEITILMPDSIELLCSPQYLKSSYLDLEHVFLSEPNSYYIEHQPFLISEITKLWDEAEWHFFNSHEKDISDEVWHEIHSLSRYGGAKLYMDYMLRIADETEIDLSKLLAYSQAEQGLLYKYKWYPDSDEKHPYDE